MADKSWKAAERRIAAKLGGKRNPNDGTHREDVTAGRLSVQVKHGAQIPKLIVSAMEQARNDAPAGQIPVAAFCPKRSRRSYATLTAAELAALCPDLVLCMEVGALAELAAEDDA